MAAPEHAQALTSAGCDTATARLLSDTLPQSGLSIGDILSLAHKVPWDKVLALVTALASRNPTAIIAAVLAIIDAIQSSPTA